MYWWVLEVLVKHSWFGVVSDAYSFPVLSTMVKTKVYIKPNMSETTSYIKRINLVIVYVIFTLILNINLFKFL